MEQSLVLECQRSDQIYVVMQCLDSTQESLVQSVGLEFSSHQLSKWPGSISLRKKGRVDFTKHILKECFQTVNEAC